MIPEIFHQKAVRGRGADTKEKIMSLVERWNKISQTCFRSDEVVNDCLGGLYRSQFGFIHIAAAYQIAHLIEIEKVSDSQLEFIGASLFPQMYFIAKQAGDTGAADAWGLIAAEVQKVFL